MPEIDELPLSPPPQRCVRDLAVAAISFVVGAGIIAYLTWYNRRTWIGEEYLVVNVTWLLFLPFLVIFGLFRESAERFGFKLPERDASRWAISFFLVMLPILLIVSRRPEFQNYYPLNRRAAFDGYILLYWELTYGFYLFCWEFFYRGFLLFGLTRAMHAIPAVLIQAAAFGMMHYGKPTPEFIGSFIAGIALGWLALRGKSFLPCFWLHWVVSALFDLLAIHSKPGGLF
jgi:uncharacterized protein